jgi:hypothetical protein
VDQAGLLLGTESERVGGWNRFEAGVSAILSGRPDRDRLLGAFVARLGTAVPGLPEPRHGQIRLQLTSWMLCSLKSEACRATVR